MRFSARAHDRLPSRFTRIRLELLEDRNLPAAVVWDGGPTGNGTDWLTAANWVGDVTPGPNDDAILNATGSSPTIALAANTTVKSVSCNRLFQLTGTQTTLTVGAGANNTSFLNLQLGSGTVLNLTNGAVVSQSTISGNGAVNVNGSATATLTNGTTVSASMNVSGGGTMVVGGSTLGGTTTVSSGSTLRVPANDQMNVTGSLDNEGTLDMSGFRILVTGVLASNSLLISHAGSVTSNEILVTSTGQFSSMGIVQANTADLVIRPNIVNTPGKVQLAGQIVADIGRSVNVVDLPVTLSQALTATGGGNIQFSGVAANIIFPIINPGATLTLSGSTFKTSGGGSITASFGQTLAIQETSLLLPLTIRGIATVGSNVVLGGGDDFTISAGGVLIMQTGFSGSASLSSNTQIKNQGTIQLIADPPGRSVLTLTGAMLSNLPGGLITTVAGAGTSTISLVSTTFSNLGTLTPAGRDLALTLSGTNPAFNNTGTVFVPASRTLTVTGGPFTNAFGTLSGFGTVVANVTGTGTTSPGTTGPGALPGQLTVTGGYTLPSGGTLAGKLNGTTAGTQYDQLKVNGTVNLGGALNLSAGFTPPVGTPFVLIDNDGADPVTGTFANLPQGALFATGGLNFQVNYAGGDGNDVILTRVVSPTVTGVGENGGAAQRSTVTSIQVTFNTVVTVGTGAFTLTYLGGGTGAVGSTVGGFTVSTATVGGVTLATLSGFTGTDAMNGSLIDGRYSLKVTGSAVTSNGMPMASDFTFADSGMTSGNQLFRLFGDADANRVVNVSDLSLFRTAFGGGDLTFDSDLNGVVNVIDLTAFRANYGAAL